MLIPKPRKPPDFPKSYRPICLLEDAGKLFERVLAARLREHLTDVGADISVSHFGFRQDRSTNDATQRVRSLSGAAVDRGAVVLAVCVDIANTFNSLPWAAIL